MSFEIRLMNTADLQPAPYNPRRPLKPGSPAWKKLERSLREFGLVEPLVWNELTGLVVGGHFRLSIIKSLNILEVPVSVVRLSPERERALNIMLNNREAQGRYDPAKLADLLDELVDLPELDMTGFNETDLRNLRLEPLEEPPMDELTTAMKITIHVERPTYERLAPRLDDLVREFDLECHVQGA